MWKASFLEQLEDKVQALSHSDMIDCVDETVDKVLSLEGNDYSKQFYLSYYRGQVTSNRLIAQYLAIVLNFLLRQMDYGTSEAGSKELGVVGCWDHLSTNPAKSLLVLSDGQRTTLHSICNLTLEIFASLESNLAETETPGEKALESSQLQLFTLCMVRDGQG